MNAPFAMTQRSRWLTLATLLLGAPAWANDAEIVLSLRRAGTPLPTNDIWIAAVAGREGVPVLTFDEHFSEIARIGVQRLTK